MLRKNSVGNPLLQAKGFDMRYPLNGPASPMMYLKRFAFLAASVYCSAFASIAAETPENENARERPPIDELQAYLTPTQKARLLRAEALIEEGESDVTAGTHFAERKASRLDPDEDIRAVKERGRKMIAAGQSKIARGEELIDELIEEAVAQRAEAIAGLVQNYDLKIDPLPFDTALRDAAKTTLARCREAGYGTVLYDGLFLTRADHGTVPSPSALRGSTYDTLIELDGTEFSVRLPINLDVQAEGDAYRYEYDNRESFEPGKIVLLQMELLATAHFGETLLVVTAVDTERHHIVARTVKRIDDADRVIPAAFGRETGSQAIAAANEAGTAEAAETASPEANDPAGETRKSNRFPIHLALTDQRDLLASLERLEPAYRFATKAQIAEEGLRRLAVETALTALLAGNSELQLYDDSFVRRAYLSDTEAGETSVEPDAEANGESSENRGTASNPAPLSRPVNALFVLTRKADSGAYRLEAVALDTEQRVTVGPARIHFGARPPAQSADSGDNDD